MSYSPRSSNAIQKNGTVAFTGNQSLGGNKLTNLAEPTANSDAATKFYVDNNGGGGGDIANGGNAFGSAISIGTQDNFALNFITNNLQRAHIGASGGLFVGDADATLETLLGNTAGLIVNKINNGDTAAFFANTDTGAASRSAISVLAGDASLDAAIGQFYVNGPAFVGTLDAAPNATVVKSLSGPVVISANTAAGNIFLVPDSGSGFVEVISGSLIMHGSVQLRDQNELRFYDLDNSNYVAFQSAAALSGNTTYVLPEADGTPGQVLTTDGAGILSWSSATSGLTNGGNTTGADISVGANDNFGTVILANGLRVAKFFPGGFLNAGPSTASDAFMSNNFPYIFNVDPSYNGFSNLVGVMEGNGSNNGFGIGAYIGDIVGGQFTQAGMAMYAPNHSAKPAKLEIVTKNFADATNGADILIKSDSQNGVMNIEAGTVNGTIDLTAGAGIDLNAGANGGIRLITDTSLGADIQLLGPTIKNSVSAGTDIDGNLADHHNVVLSGNTVLTFSNLKIDQETIIVIEGDATNPYTVDIPNTVRGYTELAFPISVPATQILLLKIFKNASGNEIVSAKQGPYA